MSEGSYGVDLAQRIEHRLAEIGYRDPDSESAVSIDMSFIASECARLNKIIAAFAEEGSKTPLENVVIELGIGIPHLREHWESIQARRDALAPFLDK